MGRLVVIGGGARSGKSGYALARARLRPPPRTFVATAAPADEEMARRAVLHRRERGDDFETVEEPLDLAGAIEACSDSRVVVVDCLTLWLCNRLLRPEAPETVLRALERVIRAARRGRHETLIVANEVGMGVVPETPLGREFRDLAGAAHQALARAADEIHVAILGVVLRVHPEPVTLSMRGGRWPGRSRGEADSPHRATPPEPTDEENRRGPDE